MISHKKIIRATYLAFENELSLDAYCSEREGFSAPVFRPLLRKKFHSWGHFTHFALGFLIFIFSPFFHFFPQVFVRFKLKENEGKGLWLIFSKRARSIYKLRGTESSSFIGNYELRGNKACIRPSFLIYLRSLFYFSSHFKFQFWKYHSLLLLPEALAFAYTLKSLSPARVFMCNHYDRWAYLTSVICSEKEIPLTLFQHGVLPQDWWPENALISVDSLVTYSKEDGETFKSRMIKSINEVKVEAPQIEIAEKKYDYTVLLLGGGRKKFVEEEISICKQVLKNKSIKTYLKPHPVYYHDFSFFYEEIKEECEFAFEFYPYADIVLHSGSTLALEYKNSLPSVRCFDITKKVERTEFESLIQEVIKSV